MKQLLCAQRIAVLSALFLPAAKCTHVKKVALMQKQSNKNFPEKYGIQKRFKNHNNKEPNYVEVLKYLLIKLRTIEIIKLHDKK